jgi:hypothetical protein
MILVGYERLFERLFQLCIAYISGYFASVSTLSQLTTLARQMHNDCVNTSSHKYIAHQLALMYVSIYIYMYFFF